MKIDIDFPTPKELLIKKIKDVCGTSLRNPISLEEIQRLVGDHFFLRVVQIEHGSHSFKSEMVCLTHVTFQVPGSDFLISIDRYDLMDD